MALSKPVVTAPIVGRTKPQHIEDAVAAIDMQLTDEEVVSLEEPYTPHGIVGFADASGAVNTVKDVTRPARTV